MKKTAYLLVLCIFTMSLPARADSFDVGSLIIPMDVDYQDDGMLRAFGLVFALLKADVQVNWTIKAGKGFGDADFTTDATDHETGAAITAHGYRGGPFVVHAADATRAKVVIDLWQSSNITVVHEATTAFTADVAKELVVAPNIAMFADGKQDVARGYMLAAGIPDSTGDPNWPDNSPDMLDPEEVSGTTTTVHNDGALFDEDGDPVYCQLMSMHWGIKDAEKEPIGPSVVGEVRAYLRNPVHFFAECQAVNAFENSVNGKFLTPHGFRIDNLDAGSPVDFYNADSPFAQLDGPYDLVAGSERSYTPCGDATCTTDGAYLQGGVVMITGQGTPEGVQDVWMTGFLNGACPPSDDECDVGGESLGKISYLGGHRYETKLPISANADTNGARLFLQSLFEAPCATAQGQPKLTFTKAGPSTTLSADVTYTISYRNRGPSVVLNATLTDPIPTGTTFVSATGGGTEAGGVVTWQLGNLGVDETGTVSVTITLGSSGTTYANTASLLYYVGTNQRTLDSNTAQTLFDADTDSDGVTDSVDICPNDHNPGQDLATDTASCGTCGTVCSVNNNTPACNAGACEVSCDTGFSDCNADASDGCEVDDTAFATDASNCGSCGNVCALANTDASTCAAGACEVSQCATGFSDCNGLSGDGCELDDSNFTTDPYNCGSCGQACQSPGTSGACTAGSCTAGTCTSGFSDCNGDTSDTCEYDEAGFDSDVQNCGGCAVVCSAANGTAACVAGACVVDSCNTGFSDCNGDASDGCEYDDAGFATDDANCGACGSACALANAASSCTAGACAIDSCNTGFSDCNALSGDGCEYDDTGFPSDIANCGGCNVSCAPANAAGACTSGACDVVCDTGAIDLDNDLSNGCEYLCTSVGSDDTTCDGVDDDCNGAFDDGYVPVATTCAVGSCTLDGMTACNAAAVKDVCDTFGLIEGPAGDATCSDGQDNDCDGFTDGDDPECSTDQCNDDVDCDDGDPCTVDACTSGSCAHSDSTDPACSSGSDTSVVTDTSGGGGDVSMVEGPSTGGSKEDCDCSLQADAPPVGAKGALLLVLGSLMLGLRRRERG